MFNFDLKKMENELIGKIDNSLKVLEKQLTLLSSETITFSIMTQGRIICEQMTELLLLKKEVYDVKNKHTFFDNINTLYRYNIIPIECYNFLNTIRIHGNSAVHGMEQSNKVLFSFLKALNYFIQWFNNYYSQNYHHYFKIENCCELINSMKYDEQKDILIFIEIDVTQSFKNKNKIQIEELKTNQEIIKLKDEIEAKDKALQENISKIFKLEKTQMNKNFIVKNKNKILTEENKQLKEDLKKSKEELKIKDEIHQKQITELNNKLDCALEKLDDYATLFEKGMEILEEANERGKRVESKVDELHIKVDNISNQISTIQSLTERRLKTAQSTEEIEKIMRDFIEECIDNIMEHTSNFKANENYEIEKRKLIYSMEENNWNKLCEKSKTFLITSKVMFNQLILMENLIDYSGICVLVTKAIEVEIQKRFFTKFLDYLYENYGTTYKKYHTALLNKKRKPLEPEKFTMGNIAFVLCYFENWNDNDKQKTNNKKQLMQYCEDCVFSRYNENEIESLLTKYASSIEEIREKYRNPSAHTNEIKRIDAEECFNLVLDVEKLLKQMLDSFDN